VRKAVRQYRGVGRDGNLGIGPSLGKAARYMQHTTPTLYYVYKHDYGQSLRLESVLRMYPWLQCIGRRVSPLALSSVH
jgi:hypothetical protein